MPVRFGRALALAIIGGAATFACWLTLWNLFWMPYWHQLNRRGIYVHDVDATYLITFGPMVVAFIFLATASIEGWFENKRFENGQRPVRNSWRVSFFGAFPGFMTLFLVSGVHGWVWRFPLSEATVCLVGMALGYLWVRWRRDDEAAMNVA
jgi:hypothetical protein